MRLFPAALLACMLSVSGLFAQSDPGWLGRFPSVKITEGNESKSLKLSELHITVEVMGNVARTTLDMTFHNDLDRVLEGELYFPLGEGQAVSRYAMDMDGALREAVPVEQQKARVAFENTVRQRVDPALLEWTQGNSFKSRVYPIPANGNKRVVVGYEQELNHTPEGDLCLLPLAFPDPLDVFEVKVQVLNATAEPKVKKPFLPNFLFKKEGTHYLAHLTEKNVRVNTPLEFVIPPSNDKYLLFNAPGEGGQYFYTHITPSALMYTPDNQANLPNSLLLLWDASASAAKRDTAKTFSVLSEYFRVLCDVEVQLMPFRDAPEGVQRFSIHGGQWAALHKVLTALPADGGTCIGCVADAMMQQRLAAEAILLVSDGVFNIGSAEFIEVGGGASRASAPSSFPEALEGNKMAAPSRTSGAAIQIPVHTLSAQPTTNFSALKRISQATGGEFVNALELTTAQALALLTQQPLRFLRAEVAGGGTVETWPSIPTTIGDDGFSLAGFASQAGTSVILHFGVGTQTIHRIQMRVSAAGSVTSDLVERMYAQKKLAELDLQYERNAAQITALGKRYGLVTRNTSLLILDRVEDYVRYEIVPPTELREEYNRLMASKQGATTATQQEHLAKVTAAFEERKTWWGRDFSGVRQQILANKPQVIDGEVIQRDEEPSEEPSEDAFIPVEEEARARVETEESNRQSQREEASPEVRTTVSGREFRQLGSRNTNTATPMSASAPPPAARPAPRPAQTLDANNAIHSTITTEEAEALDSYGGDEYGADGGESDEVMQEIDGDAVPAVPDAAPSIQQMEVITGGTPAEFGDFEGDTINATAPANATPARAATVAPVTAGVYAAEERSGYQTPPAPQRVAVTGKEFRGTATGIALAAWTPNAPYLDTLKQAPDFYATYLKMRPRYENTPSFFLDVADLVRAKGDSALALRILTNIAELKLRDHALLRVLAHRLEQTGRVDLAIFAFREVLAMRGEDPQSYRDLALAYAAAGRKDSAARYLNEVVTRTWDGRFPQIEALAACELNALDAALAQQTLPASLQHAMPCALRVVLDWDTDNCDMDLWVTDPLGEKCFYSHRQTATGGWMSPDFTGGYGPEEFWIKTALKGEYHVQINYYGSRAQTLSGPTTVQARLITGYGTPAQKTQAVTLRLESTKQVIDVGKVAVE